MAKRKTKKQKIKSRTRIAQTVTTETFTFTDDDSKSSPTITKKKQAGESLWMYDPTYIIADFKKTLALCGLFIVLLVGGYFAWHAGVFNSLGL